MGLLLHGLFNGSFLYVLWKIWRYMGLYSRAGRLYNKTEVSACTGLNATHFGTHLLIATIIPTRFIPVGVNSRFALALQDDEGPK